MLSKVNNFSSLPVRMKKGPEIICRKGVKRTFLRLDKEYDFIFYHDLLQAGWRWKYVILSIIIHHLTMLLEPIVLHAY